MTDMSFFRTTDRVPYPFPDEVQVTDEKGNSWAASRSDGLLEMAKRNPACAAAVTAALTALFAIVLPASIR